MKKKFERAGLLGISLLALGAVAAPPAMAQQQPAGEEAAEEGDEIVVVGSRIRRDNFNAPSPITVLTDEERTRAGLASTTEVLQSNAATGGGGQLNNLFGGFVVNGGSGVNTLGLRGFGPTQTLILVNGRRLSPAGVRGSVGAADLNTIPTALVDRIEILKDGASSVYGSDAVAGVVNIITNQDLDEFILEGQLNMPEQEGGGQTRISLSGGREFGPLSLTGSLEYYEREAQRFGDRDFTRCPQDLIRDPATGAIIDDIHPVTGELNCWTVNFSNSPGTTLNTIGTAARPGFGGPGNPTLGNFFRWRANPFVGDGTPGGPPNRLDGWEGVNGGGLVGFGNRDTFDPEMLEQELITPTRTTNLFLSAEWDLPGNHELYGEFLHSNRRSSGLGYIQLTLDYPNNELLPAELRLGGVQNPFSTLPVPAPTNVPLPAPFATQVRAFIGFGNTASSQEVTYNRYVGGIRGDLGFLPDWRYDFSVYYGKNDAENLQENFLVDRVFNSLVVTATIPVGTPANLIRNVHGTNVICQITATNPAYGCIPAPAVTASTIAGNLPSDYVNWIQQTLPQTTKYDESAYQFIVDGPLFSLPAGEIQAVFGLEYRTAEIDDTPDFNSINNNVYNFSSALPTRGEDSVSEAFAELEFPLLSEAPFAESLTLNVSGRYTDYDSYGAESTYKAGLIWEPVENLMFRASRGTSFRAPALFEQFLGPTTGFLAGTADPCDLYGLLPPTDQTFINCHALINDVTFQQLNGVTVFGGGGAATNLFAETSENQTIGLTWRPLNNRDGLGEFSLAIDKFEIVLSDAVAQVGANNILNICYSSPNMASEPLCTLQTRDAALALTVNNNYTNIATQESQGWDYGARYSHSLLGGEITLTANWVQYDKQLLQRLPIFAPTDFNGQIGAPEYAGDFTANFEHGAWNFRYGLTWVSSMSDYAALAEDPANSNFFLSTPDYYLHDASVQYSADAWTATFGVRNLYDEQPPRISSEDALVNGIGSVPLFSGFDYTGRQFFVNVSTRF